MFLCPVWTSEKKRQLQTIDGWASDIFKTYIKTVNQQQLFVPVTKVYGEYNFITTCLKVYSVGMFTRVRCPASIECGRYKEVNEVHNWVRDDIYSCVGGFKDTVQLYDIILPRALSVKPSKIKLDYTCNLDGDGLTLKQVVVKSRSIYYLIPRDCMHMYYTVNSDGTLNLPRYFSYNIKVKNEQVTFCSTYKMLNCTPIIKSDTIKELLLNIPYYVVCDKFPVRFPDLKCDQIYGVQRSVAFGVTSLKPEIVVNCTNEILTMKHHCDYIDLSEHSIFTEIEDFILYIWEKFKQDIKILLEEIWTQFVAFIKYIYNYIYDFILSNLLYWILKFNFLPNIVIFIVLYANNDYNLLVTTVYFIFLEFFINLILIHFNILNYNEDSPAI